MRRAICDAYHRHRRHTYCRRRSDDLVEIRVPRFALSKGYPPTVVVNDYRDVIRILERPRGAIERLVVKFPLRRRGLPNQFREVASISLVAFPASIRCKVELVPPLQFGRWRQRGPTRLLARDKIAADRHHGPAALRKCCGNNVGCACTPIEAGKRRSLYLERVHQRDDIGRDRRRLPVAECVIRQELCGAITPQVGNDDAVAGLCEKRRHIDEAEDVVGPSVEQNDGGTVRRAGLGIANVQQSRLDLLEWRKCAGAGPNVRCRFVRLCVTSRRSNSDELSGCESRHSEADEISSAIIDILGHLNSSELNGMILLVFFRSSPTPDPVDWISACCSVVVCPLAGGTWMRSGALALSALQTAIVNPLLP